MKGENMEDLQPHPGSPESGDDTLVVAGTPCADQHMTTAGDDAVMANPEDQPQQDGGDLRVVIASVMATIRLKTGVDLPEADMARQVEADVMAEGVPKTRRTIRRACLGLLERWRSRSPTGKVNVES